MKEPKTSPALTSQQQEEKEKKKRKKFIILLFFLIGFFVFGGTGLAVVFKVQSSYKTTYPTNFDVVVDPIIVTSEGENHINGAQRFVFGQDTKTSYTTHIKTQLSFGQYIYYDYVLDNKGKTNVGIKLNLIVEQKSNATLSFCVDDGETKTATDELVNIVSAPNTKTTIKVFIRIDDPNANASVEGALILLLTEEGSNDD